MEKFAIGFITVIWVIIFLLIIFHFVKFVYEWIKNNVSPIVSKQVKVVAKRMDYAGTPNGSGYTLYYITFEDIYSGVRKEFRVKAKQFGIIAEGDCGILTYQGTRFLSFTIDRK